MVDWSCRCLLKLGFMIGFFWGFCEEDSKDAIEVVYELNLLELASGNFPVMGRERERRKMMSRVMTVPGSITELDDDQASSDPDFAYFVRVHFCDIVNFVTNSIDESNTVTVSVGPDLDADNPNAILNGLEILKISNRARSLDGVDGVENLGIRQAKKSKKIGVMIAVVLGAAVVLGLLGLCYCCVARRGSKKMGNSKPKPSWFPPQLYGNSVTLTKTTMTASCIS
ncbi:putative alpha,alpha-trehalose-phosphate synthase (UDP-forming) [Helianthus annuus]|nr:putative alpha,alpha-trehalose-phosphate synthase (UDP-forming) [Helianthus annuus]